MASVTYSFSLDAQKDRRIIRWLDGLPRGEKSKAIRDALDAHLGGAGVTLGDVYQAIKDLERRVGGGFVLVQAGQAGSGQAFTEEPADVAANLDGLGL